MGDEVLEFAKEIGTRDLKAALEFMVEPLTDGLPGHLDGFRRVSHRLAAGQEVYRRRLLRGQRPVWGVGIRRVLSGHGSSLLMQKNSQNS